MAGCGGTSSVSHPLANPPASEVSVSVYLPPNPNGSATTSLAITLFESGSKFKGADQQTLMCGSTLMQFNDAAGDYTGNVSIQTQQAGTYACTYFWSQGQQQATLTIPAPTSSAVRIQTPVNRATISEPEPNDPGLLITYSPAGVAGATVTATATDFSKRAASSDPSSDTGAVTIAPQQFPPVFSAGWGTVAITREVPEQDISGVGTNTAFDHVTLAGYEESDKITVFWL
jgi:hypothetical protein